MVSSQHWAGHGGFARQPESVFEGRDFRVYLIRLLQFTYMKPGDEVKTKSSTYLPKGWGWGKR